jgi:hypothetical protein
MKQEKESYRFVLFCVAHTVVGSAAAVAAFIFFAAATYLLEHALVLCILVAVAAAVAVVLGDALRNSPRARRAVGALGKRRRWRPRRHNMGHMKLVFDREAYADSVAQRYGVEVCVDTVELPRCLRNHENQHEWFQDYYFVILPGWRPIATPEGCDDVWYVAPRVKKTEADCCFGEDAEEIEEIELGALSLPRLGLPARH